MTATDATAGGSPRVVLSCVPVGDGGGLNVARATIRAIAHTPELRRKFTVVAREQLVETLDAVDRNAVVAVSNRRVTAEVQLMSIATRHDADWVVSLFGPPSLLARRRRRATVCAYAQLFHPAPGRTGTPLRQRLTSRLRMWSLRSCDVVFFETRLLRDLAEPYLASPTRLLRVLPPSREPELELELVAARAAGHRPFRVLLFSEHRPNKRWSILPAVARELSERGCDVEFVLTSDDASEIVASAGPTVRQIGRIPRHARAELLTASDAILLVSRVESYSNNYHEAWAAGLPLVVSDTTWARAALDDAAVYVDPECPASIADGIERAMATAERRRLQANGYRELSRMATPQQRLVDMLAQLPGCDP